MAWQSSSTPPDGALPGTLGCLETLRHYPALPICFRGGSLMHASRTLLPRMLKTPINPMRMPRHLVYHMLLETSCHQDLLRAYSHPRDLCTCPNHTYTPSTTLLLLSPVCELFCLFCRDWLMLPVPSQSICPLIPGSGMPQGMEDGREGWGTAHQNCGSISEQDNTQPPASTSLDDPPDSP